MGVRSGRGDKGITDLLFHKRVSKDNADICAIGQLDELSCYLGFVKVKVKPRKYKSLIERIQHGISAIASEIVIGSEKKKLGSVLKEEDADWIRKTVFRLEQKTKLGNYFHLPGESELSAFLEIARAVARRAERSVVKVMKKEKSRNEDILCYMNCISDILFIMAREKSVKRKRKTKSTGRKKRKQK